MECNGVFQNVFNCPSIILMQNMLSLLGNIKEIQMPDITMLTNGFLHLALTQKDIAKLKDMGVTNWSHVNPHKQEIKKTFPHETADAVIRGTATSIERLLLDDFTYFFPKIPLYNYFTMWDSFPDMGYFRVTTVKGKIISICLFDGKKHIFDFQKQTRIQDFRQAIQGYRALAYFDANDRTLLDEKGIDFKKFHLFHLSIHAQRLGMYQQYTSLLKSIVRTSDVYNLLSDGNKRDIFEQLQRQIQGQNSKAKQTFLYLRGYETIHLLDLAFVIAERFMLDNSFNIPLQELQRYKERHESYKKCFNGFYAQGDKDLVEYLIRKIQNRSPNQYFQLVSQNNWQNPNWVELQKSQSRLL